MDQTPSTHDTWVASNDVRLSAGQWAATFGIVTVALALLPAVWKRVERFEPEADYRVPFALSNDYWVYQRLTETAADKDKVLLIGDSVVWGEYVAPDQTLTHWLNERAGADRFVNGGVSGAHPLALAGLIRHYTGALTDRPVMLHCNLLWLSSPQRDLSERTAKAVPFNHPTLVPQFLPHIDAYKASASDRMGVVIDHRLPFRRWVNHTRVAYFDSLDVHTWTCEHPYDNPLARVDLTLPPPDPQPRHGSPPTTWMQQGMQPQDMPWVKLDDSLQWWAVRRSIATLRSRGNRVFVVVGPFNAHMLTGPSQARYVDLANQVSQWLRDQGVPHFVAPLLPSNEYGDASHPLPAGYARIAQQLSADTQFRQWLSDAAQAP